MLGMLYFGGRFNIQRMFTAALFLAGYYCKESVVPFKINCRLECDSEDTCTSMLLYNNSLSTKCQRLQLSPSICMWHSIDIMLSAYTAHSSSRSTLTNDSNKFSFLLLLLHKMLLKQKLYMPSTCYIISPPAYSDMQAPWHFP